MQSLGNVAVDDHWLAGQFTRSDQYVDLRTMEEEAATREGKETEVFTAKQEHQWMLGNPSDPSCKKRNKRRD